MTQYRKYPISSTQFWAYIVCLSIWGALVQKRFLNWTKCLNPLSVIIDLVYLGDICLVSSAWWWRIKLENTYFKSLIYKRNNDGPRGDPYGVPDVIVLMLEEISCRKSYLVWVLRKELNQLFANPDTIICQMPIKHRWKLLNRNSYYYLDIFY